MRFLSLFLSPSSTESWSQSHVFACLWMQLQFRRITISSSCRDRFYLFQFKLQFSMWKNMHAFVRIQFVRMHTHAAVIKIESTGIRSWIGNWIREREREKKNEQTRNLPNNQQKQSDWLVCSVYTREREKEIHFHCDGWTSRATAILAVSFSYADFLFQFVGRLVLASVKAMKCNCFKKWTSICQFSLARTHTRIDTRNWILTVIGELASELIVCGLGRASKWNAFTIISVSCCLVQSKWCTTKCCALEQ